jgi:tripartite-type tricarboxylate transporter receptor subunit TctC
MRTLDKEWRNMLFRLMAALSLCAFALPASAAGYPDHAIKMIVPFAAGGGTDVLARIIAQNLNSKWGQPVVVENQPGASGAIGTRAVMKAPADGYTLLMASTGALMAVSGGDSAFDVNKVLAPIVIGAAPPYLLVVNPKLPVNSTADLIRLAKEKPDGLTFGSSGAGAASHLSGLLFAGETGIKLLHVPYKGTGPAVTDLLGARIDLMFAPGPVVQQFVQSGELKALGVTDTKRSKFYPDVPTVAESGVPGYESVGWFGLLAPVNTPPEIVKQINEAIVAAMETQEFRDHLATLGAEPKPQTPEQFGRYINADVAKWSKLVKENDVQLPGGK